MSWGGKACSVILVFGLELERERGSGFRGSKHGLRESLGL